MMSEKMNLMQRCHLPNPRGATDPKKPYGQPTVVIFGQVAALTQAASGCDQGDNPGCAVVTGNMGPKP